MLDDVLVGGFVMCDAYDDGFGELFCGGEQADSVNHCPVGPHGVKTQVEGM